MFELIIAAIVATQIAKKVDFASTTVVDEQGHFVKKETKFGRTVFTKTPTNTTITRTGKDRF